MKLTFGMLHYNQNLECAERFDSHSTCSYQINTPKVLILAANSRRTCSKHLFHCMKAAGIIDINCTRNGARTPQITT